MWFTGTRNAETAADDPQANRIMNSAKNVQACSVVGGNGKPTMNGITTAGLSNITKTNFLNLCLTVICTSGIVGFAFGFTKWFSDGSTAAILPVFPNALDSAFLIFSALYLGGNSVLRIWKK